MIRIYSLLSWLLLLRKACSESLAANDDCESPDLKRVDVSGDSSIIEECDGIIYNDEAEDGDSDDEEEEDDDEEEEEDAEAVLLFTIDDMKDSDVGTLADWDETLACDSVDTQIPTKETWATFRTTYEKVVGKDKTTLKGDPNGLGHGFQVPIYIEKLENKGRAVFVKEDVPKGTVVYEEYYMAYFDNGRLFRQYLALLPPSLACDLLQWCFVQPIWDNEDEEADDDEDSAGEDSEDDEEDEEEHSNPDRYLITCNLDEGALFNSQSYYGEQNIREGSNGQEVAMRDIAAGEELLLSYDDYAIKDGWQRFQL